MKLLSNFLNKMEKKYFENTKKLSDVKSSDYKAIVYVGGHGPVFDLPVDADSIKLIQDLWNNKKVVSAICHGPAVFVNAKDAKGQPIVNGRKLTGFSNSEEKAIKTDQLVPFSLESKLGELGAKYEKTQDWGSHVVIDGHLVTGQNPASGEEFGKAVVKAIESSSE